MTRRITNQDRRIVAANLSRYLDEQGVNPLLQVGRIKKWANGYTMKEIADEENVSLASVQASIKTTVEKIVNLYGYGEK